MQSLDIYSILLFFEDYTVLEAFIVLVLQAQFDLSFVVLKRPY